METDRFEPLLGIMKELNVQFVLGYTPDGIRHLLAAARRRPDRRGAADHRQGRHRRRPQAFTDLGNPEKHTKILVEPWR